MRGMVYGSSAGIICWGLTGGAFGIPFWWVPVVIGLLLIGTVSVAEHLAGMPTAAADDDCGFDETPFGQQAIEDAPHFRAWERELAGTWDFRNGAPE